MQQVNLNLGPLHLENLTQRTLGLLGGKGTGKTTLVKMINYQLSQDYPKLPLFVIDPLNVINIVGFTRVTVPKSSKDKGAQLAQVLNKTNKQEHLIIALREMLQVEQAEFMNAFFGAWKVHDAIISLDESHDFCPEGGKHGTYCFEIERAIRHWRNHNDGFIFATQRPSKLSKDVLELADALNLNRMTGSNDRDAAERYMKGNMPKDQVDIIAEHSPAWTSWNHTSWTSGRQANQLNQVNQKRQVN